MRRSSTKNYAQGQLVSYVELDGRCKDLQKRNAQEILVSNALEHSILLDLSLSLMYSLTQAV